MKTVFFGTPHFVTRVLDALSEASLAPDLIVTQPDRPAGRGLAPKKSAVKEWAEKHAIPVYSPEKLDADAVEKLRGYDVYIVAGYGKILPKEILSLPKYGVVNVHPSLLPKFRGPSPIESQILADSRTVGVSVIRLDEETDHGPILSQKSFSPERWPVKRSDLEALLWGAGGKLLAECLSDYLSGALTPKEQNHSEATFTPKLSKEDGLLDLSDDPYGNYLKFLAYEGWPGTFFFAERNGKKLRLKITDAEFKNGAFTILKVTPEGKKEIPYTDFLKGFVT